MRLLHARQGHLGALAGCEDDRAALLLGQEYLIHMSFVEDAEVRMLLLRHILFFCCMRRPAGWALTGSSSHELGLRCRMS